MRDLSNPLAPTFPTKEDRIRKKIKKKELDTLQAVISE